MRLVWVFITRNTTIFSWRSYSVYRRPKQVLIAPSTLPWHSGRCHLHQNMQPMWMSFTYMESFTKWIYRQGIYQTYLFNTCTGGTILKPIAVSAGTKRVKPTNNNKASFNLQMYMSGHPHLYAWRLKTMAVSIKWEQAKCLSMREYYVCISLIFTGLFRCLCYHIL